MIGFVTVTPETTAWTLWGLAVGQWARYYLPLFEQSIGGWVRHGRRQQTDTS